MPDLQWPFDVSTRNDRPIDVLCLGNALVDRLAYATLDEVVSARIEPGAMTLVDGVRAAEIEQAFAEWREVAGGSAANTAVGVASLGGSPGFGGVVGDDRAGSWYAADLERLGVSAAVGTASSGNPTGVSHVLVSDGGKRSMATSLGAALELATETVEHAGVDRARVLYIEGYLLDAPAATAAVGRALVLAESSSTLVALTLSDPFLVARHRDRIVELVFGGAVDVLIGNAEEALGLTGADTVAGAVAALRRPGSVAVVTLGASGSLVVTPDGEVSIEADDVARVEDTTGAGDLFAAGFLFGLTHGAGPEAALRLGSFAAAEVIGHLGARPAGRLADTVPAGLL